MKPPEHQTRALITRSRRAVQWVGLLGGYISTGGRIWLFPGRCYQDFYLLRSNAVYSGVFLPGLLLNPQEGVDICFRYIG